MSGQTHKQSREYRAGKQEKHETRKIMTQENEQKSTAE